MSVLSKRMQPMGAATVVALSLAACMEQAPSAPQPDMPPTACGAPALQDLVGAPLPDGFTHDGPLRVFRTGDALTMDFNPERLNIERHPQTDRVVRVFCG